MKMEEGAKIIVENWLQVKPHQYIIYICDETNKQEATVFLQAVHNVNARCRIIELDSQEIQSGKCFEELEWEMAQADAIVGATNYSFITTDAVNYALSKGVQFLSMPMSTNDDIIKDLGTRHRSAIGMSENSDAVVVVVSEETGTISVAINGELRRNYDYNTLKYELTSLLCGEDAKQKNA